MGYNTRSGKWANTDNVTVQAVVTKTASFDGPAIEVGDRGSACLDLTISAASGTTPTLDVTIQTSKDGTTWRTVAAFAQKTAAGTERKSFPALDRFIRASAVIGGTTPSFTYSVAGEAK